MRLLLTICFLNITLVAGVAADDLLQRPNIIFVMADDLGWGDVGFNGNTVIQTPHLDEMAKNGIRLTRFYTTSPLCSPTRGRCLTGRYPPLIWGGSLWAITFPTATWLIAIHFRRLRVAGERHEELERS
jgi:arylsulfatase A-like enzyme